MSHPYYGLPDRQFWKKEPGITDPANLDPVAAPPFKIASRDRIVTAGSCFAQHVARYVEKAGFNHHVTESAHPIIPKKLAEAHHYGMFSARYGNVYTARQLRQLISRAYGTFVPAAQAWTGQSGAGVVDPFRPNIQPGGYTDLAELTADRAQHLAAVRRAFEEMDVFIFTLGLTEAWIDPRDGAVFPLAPGVAGGTYDATDVSFQNFDEGEVFEDLLASLRFLRMRRPKLRIVLTVSPVPLNATFEDRHVLVSNTISKAILRLAAEKCVRSMQNCSYFPSFEIVTSPHVGGRYFAEDRREVTPIGVDHVMRLFLKHYTIKTDDALPTGDTQGEVIRHQELMERAVEVLCDESAIENA